MPTPEGPKQQDSTDIKDISNKMENITKDGKVDEKEITELNKATDFLDKNKDNKEIEKEFSKINDKINKSKPEITTGIINQLKDIALPIVLGKDQTFKRTEILTKESTQAYLNIIKRLNTGKNEKKNQDETTSKTENTKEHTQDIAPVSYTHLTLPTILRV